MRSLFHAERFLIKVPACTGHETNMDSWVVELKIRVALRHEILTREQIEDAVETTVLLL